MFSCSGQLLSALPLNPLLSRKNHLEVQDVRYEDGNIYFNEACQSYSREAGGRCSSLVAADLNTKRVLWRTQPLVSNSVLRVVGAHIVAGYGFTGERAFLRVIRRDTGRIVEREALRASHFEIEVQGERLQVEVGGKWQSFQMDGFDSKAPSLTPITAAARQPALVPRPAPPAVSAHPRQRLDPGF